LSGYCFRVGTIFRDQAVQDSISFQRSLTEQEDIDARQEIEAEGCEIVELTQKEHDAFVEAVGPQHEDARDIFGDEIFKLANL